jgi:hypothetical protein
MVMGCTADQVKMDMGFSMVPRYFASWRLISDFVAGATGGILVLVNIRPNVHTM